MMVGFIALGGKWWVFLLYVNSDQRGSVSHNVKLSVITVVGVFALCWIGSDKWWGFPH